MFLFMKLNGQCMVTIQNKKPKPLKEWLFKEFKILKIYLIKTKSF